MVSAARTKAGGGAHPAGTGGQYAERGGIYGGLLILIGGLLSGPAGVVLVAVVHPAGAWHGARALAENYHPIQTVPFFMGFVLVIGCDLLIAAAYQLAARKDRTRAMVAVICASAFTGLIVFNYVCQTTFIPALLTHYRPADAVIVSTLSLVNPRSLSWAIEMWGWGLFGVATWLIAPVFQGSRLERAASWVLIANGLVSIAGAFVTTIDLTWVMTTAGMINYAAWNVLMVVLAALVVLALRRRLAWSPSAIRRERVPVVGAPSRTGGRGERD